MKHIKLFEQFKLIKEMEEYFTAKLPKEEKQGYVEWKGKNVVWYGDPEQMIVIPSEDVHGRWGNIYDSDKLEYVKDLIRDSENAVEFKCSYGIGELVEFDNIREHQESFYKDTFNSEYDGFDAPYTTGDDDLDKYVGNEDYIDDEYSTASDEILEFMNDNKFSVIEGNKTEDNLRKEFLELEYDDMEEEEYILDEFIDMENDLAEANKNNDGDFNKFTVQLRDGHHRVMGAIEAGEDFICVNLAKESLKDYKGHYKLVK